jgi:hypothetical protein
MQFRQGETYRSAPSTPTGATHPNRLAAVAMGLTLLPTAFAPTMPARAAETGETLTFTVSVDSDVAGGHWALTTASGPDQALSVVLAEGDVPASGALSVQVPVTELQKSSTSDHFTLRAIRVLDTGSALVATATVGLTASDIADGGTVDLGYAPSHTATTYATAAEAIAATSCGTSCGSTDSTGTVTGGDSGLRMIDSDTSLVDVLGEYRPSVGSTGSTGSTSATAMDLPGAPPPPVPPMISCEDGTRPCGGLALPVPDQGCSNPGLGVTDCIVEAYDIPGVLAFRGNSNRSVGSKSFLRVETTNVQRWDDGFRLEAGPFNVSGSTEREKTAGGNDSFPLRGDCWNPPRPNDGPTCDVDGYLWNYGRDTWRWEKHLVVVCSGFTCTNFVQEILRELSYDGGTSPILIDLNNFRRGWYEPPADITTGARGSWADFLPGSETETFLDTSSQITAGAGIEITIPESFSAAEFRSSVTAQTTNKVIDNHKIRPVTETPFLGKLYRYDWGYTSFTHEFWSCEFAPGFAGAPCHPAP